jgi:hypothetical protein
MANDSDMDMPLAICYVHARMRGGEALELGGGELVRF